MYGKHFQSTYTGSMVGSGPVVFAVWGYVIANARNSSVEINPVILSAVIGCNVEEIEAAIEILCSPDPKSRSKEEDGRRLIKRGEFIYDIPTYEKYNNIRNETERKEYMKDYMRKYRQKNQEDTPVNVNVNSCKPSLAHKDKDKDKNKRTGRSVPPTVEEVKQYCIERSNGINPQEFIDHYESNGWFRGKTKIKDWKACVRTWENKRRESQKQELPYGAGAK